jgi:hypothetical protein
MMQPAARQRPMEPTEPIDPMLPTDNTDRSPTGRGIWPGDEPQLMQGGCTLRSIQRLPNEDSRRQNGCNYASDESRTTDRTILNGCPPPARNPIPYRAANTNARPSH